MTDKLLPCPFCGGTDVKLRHHGASSMSWVSCVGCGLEAPCETGATDTEAVSYWNRRAALSTPPEPVGVEVTAEEHNAAFDPANDALGGAFKDGFREGWLFSKCPRFEDRNDLEADYHHIVDIAPSECWDAYREKYFAMLPLAAIPEAGKGETHTPSTLMAAAEEAWASVDLATATRDELINCIASAIMDYRDRYSLRDAAITFRCPEGFEALSAQLDMDGSEHDRARLDDALKVIAHG